MADTARKELFTHLDLMAALSTWSDVGNPETKPFLDAFEKTRRKALAAVPGYIAAVKASQDEDLKGWLVDMGALKRWADPGHPDSGPFVSAFAAVRARALAVAAMGADKG